MNRIDVDKLKTVPMNLSKSSNLVNTDVVKRTLYDKLVAKVNDINKSGFILKSKNDTIKLHSKIKN